jgi:DNA-binding NarL/FixJ family response regulator
MKKNLKNTKTFSVWIVDDNYELACTYQQIIEASGDFQVRRLFTSAEELLHALKGEEPEIVLMDIELPGKNGVECTRILKRQWSGIKIIMVTVHEDNELVFDALKAGAIGYITKASNDFQIMESLHELVNGGAPMSSRIARMVIQSFHKNFNSPLTQREEQILKLVVSGKTFSQISEELFIARETTKSHVRNIYHKLEVNCRADAISVAAANRLL